MNPKLLKKIDLDPQNWSDVGALFTIDSPTSNPKNAWTLHSVRNLWNFHDIPDDFIYWYENQDGIMSLPMWLFYEGKDIEDNFIRSVIMTLTDEAKNLTFANALCE